MTGSPSTEGGAGETRGAKIVLLSDDPRLAGSLEAALTPEGHSIVRVERMDQVLAVLEGGTVDMAMIDLASPAAPAGGEMHAVHRAAGAAIIVCLADDDAKARAEEALRSGATRCLARPPAGDELVREVSRLLEVEAHRRALAACEEGAAACVLRKPVHGRDRVRARRRIAIAAALVIVAALVAALVAVPVVMAVIWSASRATEEAKGKLDAVERIEGYLQRDEQRELESRGR
ncbi:MAG: hypothetical protein ACYTKD_02530 [Planctomycetota bacterium]